MKPNQTEGSTMDNKTRIEKEANNYVGPGYRHDRELIKIHYGDGYNKGWNDAIEACVKLFPSEHSSLPQWQVKQKLQSLTSK